MFILYELILWIAFIIYFPILVLKKKWHKRFFTRLGFISFDLKSRIHPNKNIWIHAVSVGEVLAVLRLVQQIKERFPQYQIVLSAVTKTGYQVAAQHIKDPDVVLYAPLDFSFSVYQYVKAIQPKIYIATETEIWPNLFRVLHKNQIPIVLINGRISDKSYHGYKKVSFFIRRILQQVDAFCMQSPLDVERIISLGALKQRVHMVGNVKFDELVESSSYTLEQVGFSQGDCLWIAGSTHPGEEEMILDVYKSIYQDFPQLRLVIAPRHIERIEEVIKIIAAKGFLALKLSQIRNNRFDQNAVVVVDLMGKLRALYPLAKIVFIGKTLVPGGGQNMIEPAYFGKPVLVGPYTENFRDVMNIFLESAGIIQVQNAQEFLSKIVYLFRHPEEMKRIGQIAQGVVQKQQGATAKTLQIITHVLSHSQSPNSPATTTL